MNREQAVVQPKPKAGLAVVLYEAKKALDVI